MDQKVLQVYGETNELAVLNISSKDIGALSKEVAERILRTKDTDYIHQVMYVPIEKKEDLEWLIRCVGQALGDEDEDDVALEIADLLYFFVIPFYEEDLLSDRHLYEQIGDVMERLASRNHSEINTLIHEMKEDLAVVNKIKSL
ncbi:hypothetical protein BACPU_23340 [Bacillus pumilus]|nr:hypothetical protein BACPU_23340 [Bacillus pumilus]